MINKETVTPQKTSIDSLNDMPSGVYKFPTEEQPETTFEVTPKKRKRTDTPRESTNLRREIEMANSPSAHYRVRLIKGQEESIDLTEFAYFSLQDSYALVDRQSSESGVGAIVVSSYLSNGQLSSMSIIHAHPIFPPTQEELSETQVNTAESPEDNRFKIAMDIFEADEKRFVEVTKDTPDYSSVTPIDQTSRQLLDVSIKILARRLGDINATSLGPEKSSDLFDFLNEKFVNSLTLPDRVSLIDAYRKSRENGDARYQLLMNNILNQLFFKYESSIRTLPEFKVEFTPQQGSDTLFSTRIVDGVKNQDYLPIPQLVSTNSKINIANQTFTIRKSNNRLRIYSKYFSGNPSNFVSDAPLILNVDKIKPLLVVNHPGEWRKVYDYIE